MRMKFMVDKIYLTDGGGAPVWSDTMPLKPCCETGVEAGAVLTAIVLREGGVELGISAQYADGQAITVARMGAAVCALRATPAETE
jgi:hypothetical protein